LKSQNNSFADKSLHWNGKRRATPVTIVMATLAPGHQRLAPDRPTALLLGSLLAPRVGGG